jgi:hypothetical protein
MSKFGVSRRNLLEAGGFAAAGAAASPVAARAAWSGRGEANETIIRKWYAGWETRNWDHLDAMLADDFTFSSANNDDHISKSAFKTRCWEPNIDFIKRFDLEEVIGNGDECFVKYLCHTKNGKSFRNVEFFRLSNNKIESIECYFGEMSSFPSAVSSKHT